MRKRTLIKVTAAGLLSVSIMAGCSTNGSDANKAADYNNMSIQELTKKAKKEGAVNSVGMPDSWANWKETWGDIQSKYGIKHTDTDMSSAEELAKFESEKQNATADIGDVGAAFGPLAEQKGLTLPYKTKNWKDIPNWAKDKDGNWVMEYTGSIAFITDKNNVKNPPKSWKDLENGNYKVDIGDVLKASQAQFGVLAASYANGGNEKNIKPGVDFFAKLAKQGRLQTTDPTITALEKGEIDVAIVWDFNGLGYRDQIDKKRFDVVIPKDASVTSGYASIINKNAKDPYAAMLSREYILSDKGQANLARGYARPIRENVKLPADAKAKLLPKEMYKNARPLKDTKTWGETTQQLLQQWPEKVLINVK